MKFQFFLIFSILTGMLMANPKKAITFEDFFETHRIDKPVVSPDGKMVAFAVKTYSVQTNDKVTEIQVIDLNGELKWKITRPEGVSSPFFNPHTNELFFLSGKQVYRFSENGEHQKISEIYSGISAPKFSPDGKYILFQSEVYPDCKSQECIKNKDEARENDPVKARIYDHLLYRHWNAWRTEKRNHLLLINSDGGEVVDLTPGSIDVPTLALGSSHDFCFSPDSKKIAWVANHDKMVAASTNNDIFEYSLAEKSVTRISQGKGNDRHPVYSPDGKYLAWLSMERAGFEADRNRVMVYEFKSQKIMELTRGFDLSAEEIIWSPDGKEIYFAALEKGYSNVYRIGLKDKKIEPVLSNHYAQKIAFAGNEHLVANIQSARMPIEVFKFNLTDKELTQITFLNRDKLADVELPDYETFWFEGANGKQVQGFIMKPPFFEEGKKYPAVQMIHGGPQGMFGDVFHYRWNYQMFASKGYVVYWINFHGSKGYGQEFTDAISGHWGDLPYEDLVKGTEYVITNYNFVDADRLAAAGASYGGFMVNWILGHENPFKCLVSHDGVYDQVSMWGGTEELWFPEWEFGGLPWEEGTTFDKWSPSRLAGNFKTPTLVIHGEQDLRVPYTQGLQLFSALQRQGVPSRLLFYPDEDHFVQKPQNARLWWKTVHDWLAEYLQ